ncbi:hypothetical protein [Pararhodobacter zhoushanensis]|uniref:Uncharacterized protein n=1 Tax=Pararhodobacter zhoushanensis TaxID=2479545 RepID=A0ABT3GTE0_9RHOB|nr:hypothetical protein [Pararhodobacter zhoushanensis]MCW1930776.1 hypothetical protein [Pararhodobacter zhoushanensis]
MTRPVLALIAALFTATSLPAAAQDGMVWAYNRYIEASPLDTFLGLTYGIPETDAVQASITCAIGANWIYGDVTVGADVEGLADGADVALAFQSPGYSATHQGTVIRQEEGMWGVSFAVDLTDPFWNALMTQPALTYGVPGRPTLTLPLAGADIPTHDFLGDCTQIGDLQPEAAPSASK